MSALIIYLQDRPNRGECITDFETIAARLAGIGVQFERWQASGVLSAKATPGEVLDLYGDSVDRLMKQYGFQSADVISVTPDHPQKETLRRKFLAEHTHSDFEVRFFVEGKGLFYLHVHDKVYAVLCEQGDLISVPAGTTHWFDMGENPRFTCIRLFTTPDGWTAVFTGSDIAERFPGFDQYIAELSC